MDNKRVANIFVAFRKLLRNYTDFQLEELKDFNLTPNEISVLSAVSDFSMASDIAANVCVSKALVSRSVKELKEKGLIVSTISEVDKREQRLKLTEQGERVAMLIEEINDRFFRIVFDGIGETEQEVLDALLRLTSKNLDDAKRYY